MGQNVEKTNPRGTDRAEDQCEYRYDGKSNSTQNELNIWLASKESKEKKVLAI